MNAKQFKTGWEHFCKCVDFNHTNLDAEAITFMNEMPAATYAALERDALATTPRRCRVCGCTDAKACPDGCYWITENLCSRCDKHGWRGTKMNFRKSTKRSSKK